MGTVDGNGEGDLDPIRGDRRGIALESDAERDLVIALGTSGRCGADGFVGGAVDSEGTSRCDVGPDVVSCDVTGVGGCMLTTGVGGGSMSEWEACVTNVLVVLISV